MDIDCTEYLDEKKCPKKVQILKNKTNSNNLNVLMVGCWGVYCWDGEIKMIDYKPPNEEKKGIPNIYFEEYTEIYGSKRVVQGMVDFTKSVQTHAVFLAGDNVYNYNKPKEKLVMIVNQKQFPTKKMYKLDHTISGQNIDIQLKQGFQDCFQDIKVEDFYVAIGNHDVVTCYDLNQQLKFALNPETRYRLPAIYYNVIYPMKNYAVNFIIIDTNVFEENPISCSGKKFNDNDKHQIISTQVEWVIDTLKRNNCLWNIIIGHIPYKANPHKQKENSPNYILNPALDHLFRLIKSENCPKVQTYFCADEHNQQFLYDYDNKMALTVAGSGGTILDKKIVKGNYWNGDEVKTLYYSNNFGFVSFSFTYKDHLNISYYESSIKDSTRKFSALLNKDGILL